MFNNFKPVFYIPKNTEYIFVSDMFVDDYAGGAELTLEAIISTANAKTFKLHSSSVTENIIEKNKNKYWIFGNFSNLTTENLIKIATSNIKFSVIECDYKYCKFRSSHLHKLQTGEECNCHKTKWGKIIRKFFSLAQNVFFMSEKQMGIYIDLFPDIKHENFIVQSSTFTNSTLEYIEKLLNTKIENSINKNTWVILHGGSWIKAEQETINWCKKNNLQYTTIGGLVHKDFLKKISEYKGLVFMPAGFDTAPRIVIEAKLLGLDLHLNENVQHKDEKWFSGSIEECERYLKTRNMFFWSKIKNE